MCNGSETGHAEVFREVLVILFHHQQKSESNMRIIIFLIVIDYLSVYAKSNKLIRGKELKPPI